MTSSNVPVDSSELEGAVPVELWVSDDEHDLRIVFADGRVLAADTEGDCCSESWWADIVGVKQLIGATIRSAGGIDLPEPIQDDDRSRQEEDEAYGYRIDTSQGACELIFRNSSNGYYGGWCKWKWVEDSPSERFRRIVEDWRA